jgi:hypothetical protein
MCAVLKIEKLILLGKGQMGCKKGERHLAEFSSKYRKYYHCVFMNYK